MQQFEIWRLAPRQSGAMKGAIVVLLQHTRLQDLDTCVVAPLRPLAELPALGRLRPEITTGRKRYRLIVDRTSVVHRRDLLEQVGSAETSAETIKRAIDELYFGI